MKSTKHVIIAHNRATGQPEGYVKSVSYTGKKFTLTPNKQEAKTYTNAVRIQDEIDDLTFFANGMYVFLIN
jgi:hypothetical protein